MVGDGGIWCNGRWYDIVDLMKEEKVEKGEVVYVFCDERFEFIKKINFVVN